MFRPSQQQYGYGYPSNIEILQNWFSEFQKSGKFREYLKNEKIISETKQFFYKFKDFEFYQDNQNFFRALFIVNDEPLQVFVNSENSQYVRDKIFEYYAEKYSDVIFKRPINLNNSYNAHEHQKLSAYLSFKISEISGLDFVVTDVKIIASDGQIIEVPFKFHKDFVFDIRDAVSLDREVAHNLKFPNLNNLIKYFRKHYKLINE
jgi:hypothetical protein